ncbi:MAG: flagellar basal body-associated FliL family protein [Hahellaceae bacterium]|jgi:flagellar FliL protein|nr:flagellar basal body-associated FliL family protein [Hahellaceae bacterium]MCP5213263.1 flagellar basal body-associated FliL family protein [Hahellaceae bacterium]
MAEKKVEEAPAEEGGKSNKKMLIIIVIVVILTIAVSVGATFFLLGDKEEGAESAPAEVAEPVKLPALYYEVKPPFIVAMNVDGKQRYMQIYASVMARDQAALDTLDMHMPLIRNKMIMLYSSQDFEAVQTLEGKEQLRLKSKEIIQEVLAQEAEGTEIEQVLFTNFVMQ